MSDLKSNNPFRPLQQEAELSAPPPVHNSSIRPPTYHPTQFGKEYQEHVNSELRNWQDPDGLQTLTHPFEFDIIEEPIVSKMPWWRTTQAKKAALAIGVLVVVIAGVLVFALAMTKQFHQTTDTSSSLSHNATTIITRVQTAAPTRSLMVPSDGSTDALVVVPSTSTSLAVVTANPSSGSASVLTSTALQVVESTSTLTPSRSTTKSSSSTAVVSVSITGGTVWSTTVITTTPSPSPQSTVTLKTTIT